MATKQETIEALREMRQFWRTLAEHQERWGPPDTEPSGARRWADALDGLDQFVDEFMAEDEQDEHGF